MRTDHSNEVSTRRRWWVMADLVVVLAFVLIGRESHDEGNALIDVLRTAAPFLIGLAAGRLVTRNWRDLLDPRSGAAIATVTVIVGLAVRRVVIGDGIAFPFIIVATLFLVAGLVGWRLLVTAGRRLSVR